MADESQQPSSGNAASDTSALDTHQAAAVFANLLDSPPPDEQQKDEPAKVEAEAETPPVEAEAEGAAEEGKTDEKTFTVVIDGKEVQLTQDELINGYKAQKASTQKFEAAAALRKEAEAVQARATQERQQYTQGLKQTEAMLTAALVEQNKIDWNALIEQDPQEFLKQKHLHEQRQAALQETKQRLGQVGQIEFHERVKAHVQNIEVEQQELLAKLPEWKDEAKASDEKKRITQELLSRGFTEDMIFGKPFSDGTPNPDHPGLTNHKILLLARDAMLYRETMSKAKAAAQKVSNLPQKVERPGTGENGPVIDRRTSEWNKFAKSGKAEDAAAIFSRLL